MNFGTFAGPGTGVPYGSISRYIQTPVITTSQTIAVPPGTQRIEALLVGGGGSGVQAVSNYRAGGGGFGGAAIIEIPITGSPLQIVIGAGGSQGDASTNTAGSPTYVVSAGTRYAEVGGGGAGLYNNYTQLPDFKGNGRSGGGGGGGAGESTSTTQNAGNGGSPPIGNLLWSIYPQSPALYGTSVNNGSSVPSVGSGAGGNGAHKYQGSNGSFGGGGGGGTLGGIAGYGGGGAASSSSFPGSYGGGSGPEVNGGSLTAVTVWGFTGRAGGTGATACGGGGGGLFGAGSNAVANTSAGNGGLGGGGGGGTELAFTGATAAGNGGSGAAVIRFYL